MITLRHGGLASILWIAPVVALAQNPTYSVRITEINGIDVPGGPADTVDAAPCDVLTAEVFLRNWSPAGQSLRGFQLAFDAGSFTSGSTGNIYPIHYGLTTDVNGKCSQGTGVNGTDNPAAALIDSSPCSADGDPQGSDVGSWSFETPCDPLECIKGGPCTSPTINFIHDGQSPLTTMNTLTCGYAYASALLGMGGPVSMQNGSERYCATLRIRVSEDAGGTFTLGLKADSAPDSPGSFLLDQNSTLIGPLGFEDATVVIGAMPPATAVIDSTPPDEAIDAAQPTTLDGTLAQGWDRVTLQFDGSTCGMVVDEFALTTIPPNLVPALQDFNAAGSTVTFTFAQPLTAGARTVITHIPTGDHTCLGVLPADSNGDGTAGPLDILSLIDDLNGIVEPPLEPWQSDINRSGQSEPLDILRLIDLLNGAEAFAVWNGTSLPPCP